MGQFVTAEEFRKIGIGWYVAIRPQPPRDDYKMTTRQLIFTKVKMFEELDAFCNELEGRWTKTVDTFYFEKQSDFFFFKLRWS